MNTTHRFLLQSSKDEGYYVATDARHGIVVKFREHQFNETQEVTLLGGDTFKAEEDALASARYIRELADWLAKTHPNVVF